MRQQFVETCAVVRLDRRKRERERLRHALLAQRLDVGREGIEGRKAVLAREDQFGIGLRQPGGVDFAVRRCGVVRMEQPHEAPCIALPGAEDAQHAGRAVAVILQVGFERMAHLALPAKRRQVFAQPPP